MQIKTSHVLWSAGKVTFCYLCGAFSEQRTYNLASLCAKHAVDATSAYRRQRLRSGHHPLTNEWLGKAEAVNLIEAWELQAAILDEVVLDDGVGG